MRIPLCCWCVGRTTSESNVTVPNPPELTQQQLPLWVCALESPWPNAQRETCETITAASCMTAKRCKPLDCSSSGEWMRRVCSVCSRTVNDLELTILTWIDQAQLEGHLRNTLTAHLLAEPGSVPSALVRLCPATSPSVAPTAYRLDPGWALDPSLLSQLVCTSAVRLPRSPGVCPSREQEWYLGTHCPRPHSPVHVSAGSSPDRPVVSVSVSQGAEH